MDSYPLAKALHIVGFVCWFAGLFYIVRLFIYRVEAKDRPDHTRSVLEAQLAVMSRRLWFGIAWPSMIVTLVLGGWLLQQYGQWSLSWVHVKLSLIAVLSAYHVMTHRVFRQLEAGCCAWTSAQLRLWNEVATLLLVAIVFVAVFKQGLDALWATIGFFGFAGLLMVGIKLYGRIRQR